MRLRSPCAVRRSADIHPRTLHAWLSVAFVWPAGDCLIHSRTLAHGSSPNASEAARVTLYFGFYPMAEVSKQHDAAEIVRHQLLVPFSVAARAAKRPPSERPFVYSGLPENQQQGLTKAVVAGGSMLHI